MTPNRCVKERPRQALNYLQTSTMFFIPVAGICCGFLALIWELWHYRGLKQRPEHIEDQSQTLLQAFVHHLTIEYKIKEISNGNNSSGKDVWVCFTPGHGSHRTPGHDSHHTPGHDSHHSPGHDSQRTLVSDMQHTTGHDSLSHDPIGHHMDLHPPHATSH